MSESEALPVEQWLGWDSKVPNRPRKKNQKISTNKRWKGGTEK